MALLALGIFLLQGFQGPLTRDVSVYAYAGQQVAEGVPPYVAILNRAGPLAHLVPGAGAALGRLVGADDLLAMRVTMTVVSALAVWAAYVLGRDLFGTRLTGVMAATALLSFQGFVVYATGGPREKSLMVLFVLLTLWAVARRQWLAAGTATALATLTWQGSFFPLAAVVLAAAFALPDARRTRISAVLRWAGAGLAVTLATVLCFVALGAVAELYEGFFAINAGYTTQRGLLTVLAAPRRLFAGFGWSLALVVAGVLGSLVVAGLGLRRFDREAPGEVTAVALGVGTLVCLLWSLSSFEGWPDMFLFLPFAACGLAGLGHLVLDRWPSPVTTRVAGGALALLVAATATTAVTTRPTTLAEQRRHTEAVLGVLDDPELLAISNPTPLVLTHARNPIRYQLFSSGQADYLRATYPGGMRGLAREVERADPTLITVYGHPWAWLKSVLEGEYVYLGGRRKPFAWYVSLDRTTEAEREQLRRVVQDTLPPATASDVQRSLP